MSDILRRKQKKIKKRVTLCKSLHPPDQAAAIVEKFSYSCLHTTFDVWQLVIMISWLEDQGQQPHKRRHFYGTKRGLGHSCDSVCVYPTCVVLWRKRIYSITPEIFCIFFHKMFKRVPLLFTFFDAFSRINETVGLKNESRRVTLWNSLHPKTIE